MLAHNRVGLPARFRIDGVEHRAIGERLVRRALGDVKPGGSQPLHEVRQLSGRWVDHGVHVHRGLCGSVIRRRNGAGGQRDELQRGALRESRSQRREADRAHGFAERDRRVHALRRRLPPEIAAGVRVVRVRPLRERCRPCREIYRECAGDEHARPPPRSRDGLNTAAAQDPSAGNRRLCTAPAGASTARPRSTRNRQSSTRPASPRPFHNDGTPLAR